MRNALINWLNEKAKEDKSLVLITGDLGYSVIEPFIEKNSSRFINVGVAEQNMAGISAGLALEGFRPYNYSIGIFPTFRCAEQIRNDIDYHDLPVVICAIGSGVAYGNLGYSHHAIQDISLMRALPNMMIGTPCDPAEVREILDYHYDNQSPLYLRIHKAGEKILDKRPEKMRPGGLREINTTNTKATTRKTKQSCILCIGHITSYVQRLSEEKLNGIPIYSVPLWSASSSEYFAKQIKEYQHIITVEDHVLEGGFGSYVLEVAAKYNLNVKVKPIALQEDIVGKVAREGTLLEPIIEELDIHIEEIRKRDTDSL